MIVGLAMERADSPEANFEFGEHRIVRRFSVTTTSVLDGPIHVANAPGIPRMFQLYYFGTEFHPYARVRDIVPRRIAPGSLQWEVEVTYRTPSVRNSGGQTGGSHGGDPEKDGTGEDHPSEYENPTFEIPEVETQFHTDKQSIYGCTGWGVTCSVTKGSTTVYLKNTAFMAVGDNVTVSYRGAQASGPAVGGWPVYKMVSSTLQATITTINAALGWVEISKPWQGPSVGNAVLIDQNFKPVQGSNGEPYAPPPAMDSSTLVLTISRNEDLSAPHPALSLIYQDAVNADAFWDASPGQVKVQSITCRRQTRQIAGGTIYPFLRVTYVFHFKPSWDIQLLDKGTWYWEQRTKADPTLVKKSFRSDDGQPIEGLLDGNGGQLATGALPQFIAVRPYNWLPFAALNLPQAFTQVQ